MSYDADNAPQDWLEAHERFRDAVAPHVPALLPSGASSDDETVVEELLSRDWWLQTMSRIHPNAFRVDRAPPVRAGDSPLASGGLSMDDLAALASAAVGSAFRGSLGKAGSAVFFLPSFFNHECEPNVDVQFPEGGAPIRLVTRRSVEPGEELTITYIDSRAPAAVRRDALMRGYGFRCACWACLMEDAEGGSSAAQADSSLT
ncbi:unnamed protein product [Pedinophyceae sp. YPF-701]|nr:unnamed protein product [Pedinophyceae sp. YPF-701]